MSRNMSQNINQNIKQNIKQDINQNMSPGTGNIITPRPRITPFHLCLIGMAVGINVAGGQIALVLRLPIYLDSIGTILIGALMGPVYGMLPNLLSGIVMGMTTDIYSLYFAPVGMLVGLMAGLVWKSDKMTWRSLLWSAAMVTVPGTIASSVICAVVFGGITSSGSTILVQLLAKTPLGMTVSVFVVQIMTDYLDRLISIAAVSYAIKALPADMKRRCKGGNRHGRAAGAI